MVGVVGWCLVVKLDVVVGVNVEVVVVVDEVVEIVVVDVVVGRLVTM